MSKRRNAKKEKAERNKINARKFRKPTSKYYGKRRRYSSYNKESNEQKSSSSEQNDKNQTAQISGQQRD